MNSMSVCRIGLLPIPDNDINIINRREIEPLLAKARQVLMHYDKAIDCCAAILDRSGHTVKTLNFNFKKQMRFCELCKKYFHNSSQIWQGYEYPCEKIHHAALVKSWQGEGAYIYACAVGFIYWISPLYQNGRYAGAMIAGQIPLHGRNAAVETFRTLYKDKIATEKFSRMVEEVPEKKQEEIQAMAQLLDVCAREISETRKASGKMIRRMAWKKTNSKVIKEPVNLSIKKTWPLWREAALEYPLEKERMLLAAFRRGDNETGSRILRELMDYIIQAIPENLEIIRFRAMELMVLLSRATVSETSGSDTLLEANNRYLRQIQESKTAEELIENLNLIANRMASKIFSFQGICHAPVLRRAERYIWENYTRKVSLQEIAKASGLSAPYFSTIFKEEMGENLSSYLNRLRVEKATTLLKETGKSLNKIAEICGFEDQSWFSKIFKNFTGMSPGKFRENGGRSPEFRSGRNYAKGEIRFPESMAPSLNKQDMLSS